MRGAFLLAIVTASLLAPLAPPALACGEPLLNMGEEELLRALRSDREAEHRRQAAELLGLRRTAAAVPVLLAGAGGRERSPAARAAMILALARIQEPKARALALTALGDGAPEVRASAARAVAILRPPDAARHLRTRLAVETAPEPRAALYEALGDLADPAALPALTAALAAEPTARAAAISALGKLPDAAGLTALAAEARGVVACGPDAQAILRSLAQIGKPAVDTMIAMAGRAEALTAPCLTLRAEAITALGRLRAPNARPLVDTVLAVEVPDAHSLESLRLRERVTNLRRAATLAKASLP